VIEFFVAGEPKTAGSKNTGIVLRKDESGRKVPAIDPKTGLPRTFTADSTGEKGKAWRSDVRDAAQAAMAGRPPLEGPLVLDVRFLVPRPKGHYGSGRNAGVLKDSAPRYPTTIPDSTKMLRAVEDALKGLCWRDDAQVTTHHTRKRYAVEGRVGAEVSIRPEDGAVEEDVAPPQLALVDGGLAE
jgi:crossover junction endodeoxyribonuclease RusA